MRVLKLSDVVKAMKKMRIDEVRFKNAKIESPQTKVMPVGTVGDLCIQTKVMPVGDLCIQDETFFFLPVGKRADYFDKIEESGELPGIVGLTFSLPYDDGEHEARQIVAGMDVYRRIARIVDWPAKRENDACSEDCAFFREGGGCSAFGSDVLGKDTACRLHFGVFRFQIPAGDHCDMCPAFDGKGCRIGREPKRLIEGVFIKPEVCK